MMNYILSDSKIKQINNIYLTFDNDNIYAIKLYIKHNFNEINKNELLTTMLLTK